MNDFIIIIVISIVFIAGFFFGLGRILQTRSAKELLSSFCERDKSIFSGRSFFVIIGLIVFVFLLWLIFITIGE